MSDLLRDNPATGGIDPVIPTTQPYTAALNPRFTRVGIYDGSGSVNETINPAVFNTTGNDAIVEEVGRFGSGLPDPGQCRRRPGYAVDRALEICFAADAREAKLCNPHGSGDGALVCKEQDSRVRGLQIGELYRVARLAGWRQV